MGMQQVESWVSNWGSPNVKRIQCHTMVAEWNFCSDRYYTGLFRSFYNMTRVRHVEEGVHTGHWLVTGSGYRSWVLYEWLMPAHNRQPKANARFSALPSPSWHSLDVVIVSRSILYVARANLQNILLLYFIYTRSQTHHPYHTSLQFW